MHVFLIHGMGRSPVSMWGLAIRLRWAGYGASLFGYSVTVEPLDSIAERFRRHIEGQLDGREDRRYAVVGHSLGNIITRLASPGLPAGFERFIMMAPPNRPPAVARELQDNPLFQLLTSDAGQRLCDDEFYARLPMPPGVPALVIAGNRGVRGAWHPLGEVENDAVVSVEETWVEGVPQVIVSGIHSFLMNRADVFSMIRRFLEDAEVEVPDGARIGDLV
ncbi:MAG: alpha/beta fold hydrolase [Acidobacteriota bacterium]